MDTQMAHEPRKPYAAMQPAARLAMILALLSFAQMPVATAQTEAPRSESAGAPAQPPSPQRQSPQAGAGIGGGVTAEQLLHVPISPLIPGGMEIDPKIENPMARDPDAIQRGEQAFNSLNCVGCHAPNGGGGMGPALSNSKFIYGAEPANIFLSIYQGRPNGMPAWGAMLPAETIWDLVTYVGSISKEPTGPWGRTISRQTLKIEQVPAEYIETPTPWDHTEPFSGGRKPDRPR